MHHNTRRNKRSVSQSDGIDQELLWTKRRIPPPSPPSQSNERNCISDIKEQCRHSQRRWPSQTFQSADRTEAIAYETRLGASFITPLRLVGHGNGAFPGRFVCAHCWRSAVADSRSGGWHGGAGPTSARFGWEGAAESFTGWWWKWVDLFVVFY